MIQKYIDKIVLSKDDSKMKELERVLVNTIDYIQRTDNNVYCDIKDDLYEIAEGKTITEDIAKDWVAKMQPKAMWTMQEVQQAKTKFQCNMPLVALYVIMNMLFSDLGDVIGEEMTDEVLEKYIRAAEDWYYDEDASRTEDEKLYFYWKCIVN